MLQQNSLLDAEAFGKEKDTRHTEFHTASLSIILINPSES